MTTSPLSPEEIHAAAEVHRELGPQYSDSVVQAFLEKVDAQVEARIAASIAAAPLAPKSRPDPSAPPRRRAFLAGTAAGLAAAGVPLTILAARTAHDFGQFPDILIGIWVVIGVAFIATVAGLTGAVTIRVSSPAKKRHPGSAA